MRSNSLKVAILAGLLGVTSGIANAAPITTYDAAVTEWAVGTGQTNDHFAVTTDGAFAGGAIELGLRAQQRRVGSITPSPAASANYLVQTGSDPSQLSRAWWNFDMAVTYGGLLVDLDSLTLRIVQSSGTNSGGGTFDLLNPLLFAATNADNTPTGGEYKASQNPVFFPWFTPAFNVSNANAFSYWFFLTATATNPQTQETTSVTAQMCVHTSGVHCVPEPSSLTMIGAMGALLFFFSFVMMRRRVGA